MITKWFIKANDLNTESVVFIILLKMKVLLICILFAYVKAASVPVELKSLLTRATEHCIAELNLNKEKYEKALFGNEKFPEDDEEFGKFYGCVGNERGHILKNGELNLPLMHAQLEELIEIKFGHSINKKEIAHEIKESCFSTSKADKPNNLIRVHNCAIEHVGKHTIEHIQSELESAKTHCIEKLNLNKEKYEKVFIESQKFPEDDDEFGKLYGCVGDERKHFLENGELNLPLIHKQIEQLIVIKFQHSVDSGVIAQEVKEHCFATSKADKPKNGIRAHNCAIEHIGKHTIDHLKSELERATTHCTEKLNLDKEKYEKAFLGNQKFPDDDEEFGKLYSCVGDERKHFLESGELNLPLIHKQIRQLIAIKFQHSFDWKEIAQEVKRECFSTAKADKPKNGIRAHNCAIEHIDKHIIDHLKSELERATTHCVEKLNLNKEKYGKVFLENQKFPEDDDEFGKLYGCVGDERRHFLENGELNLPLIHKQIEQLIAIKFEHSVDSGGIAQEVEENCFATSKADKPKNGIRAHNCAMEHIEKHTIDHLKSELERATTHCTEKLNLDKEKYKKVFLENQKFSEDDEEFGKLYSCVGDERRHFLENGELNLPLIHKQIEQLIAIKFQHSVDWKEIAQEVKRECFSTAKADKPKNGIRAHNCAMEHIEKHIIDHLKSESESHDTLYRKTEPEENCFATSKADKPKNGIRAHNCAMEHIEKHTIDHLKSELERATTHCTEKLNLDKEKYEKVFLENQKFSEDDEEFGKLYSCVGDERRHFLENGELNLPLIHKQIEQLIAIKFQHSVDSGVIAQEVRENCFATSKADKPKNGIRAHNCAIEHIGKHHKS